jgi:membrane-bound ClpP family serine protease
MAVERKIDGGAVAEVVGFVALVVGVAGYDWRAAAVVAGVILIAFGAVKQ